MVRGESGGFPWRALAAVTAGALGGLWSLGGCGNDPDQPTTTMTSAGDDAGDAGQGGPIVAQMNDVSIMFPLPRAAADIGSLLAPSAVGARGTLVPAALYTRSAELPGSTMTSTPNALSGYTLASYDDLRVVSVRIDPCFAVMHPDPHGVGCPPQVRLVFQEVRASDGGAPQAFDSALHAIYALPRSELLTLARELVALRQANDAANASAGSLRPHPVIVQQGLAGAMSTGVQKLILQHVGEENLVRVAMFGTDDQINWTFRANDLPDAGADAGIGVDADAGVLTTAPFAIPNETSGDPHVQTLESASRPPDAGTMGTFALGWFFQAIISSPDDIEPLGGANENPTTQTSNAAFAALLRLEDPTQRTFNTTDCGSCHLSSPLAKLIALPEGNDDTTTATSGNDARYAPDGKSVTAADMATMYDLTLPRIDLHAFSYDLTSPTVNQRVVNESSAIVEYFAALP